MHRKVKIKIQKNGPYIVSGNVKLDEQIIVPKGKGYEFVAGRTLPQSEQYELCRCGKSKNAPFCDKYHEKIGFDGTETASRARYEDRAELIEGPGLTIMDDHRCAMARFCHREDGHAWWLTKNSEDPKNKEEAITASVECPAGRLVALDEAGKAIEPEYEPTISILQDPEKGVSGGLFVKGNIPIEASDGHNYEIRNRVVLCRCGQSKNKPFCDISHIPSEFLDR